MERQLSSWKFIVKWKMLPRSTNLLFFQLLRNLTQICQIKNDRVGLLTFSVSYGKWDSQRRLERKVWSKEHLQFITYTTDTSIKINCSTENLIYFLNYFWKTYRVLNISEFKNWKNLLFWKAMNFASFDTNIWYQNWSSFLMNSGKSIFSSKHFKFY